MALRNIVKGKDDILSKRAREVVNFNRRLGVLIDDMADTMYEHDGCGLAANQVGVLRRVVVIDAGEGLIELVNPEIIESKGEQEGAEGCLSFPGEYGITKRPMFVKVRAFDRHGNEFTAQGEGLLARAFCHEIDHLDGVVFKSKVIRMVNPDEIE